MSISSIGGSSGFNPYSIGVTSSPASSSQTDATSARAEFDKFSQMTPAQKMRAMMLAKLGVTEEQLKAMSPDERAKVEQKLKDMVKQQFEKNADGSEGKKTGVIADVTA